MFELSQLRCFVAVAEELHFGRAAVRLNMTQPPLSRQIQVLEHALGVAVLERTTRTVRLTAAGRHFLPEAQRLLRLAEGAALAVKRVADGDAGSVRLGFTAGSSYAFLPWLVGLVARRLPDVALVLREMVTADQMAALAAGRLDAGLVRLPVDRRSIDMVRVAQDRMLLAVPAAHPLAVRPKAPSLHELGAESVIMYSPEEGRFFHDLVVRI